MNYERHRPNDACGGKSGKVWTWLVINRTALNHSDSVLPNMTPKIEIGGFDNNAQQSAGWREALGGWRRQNLTRQLCDHFFHPLRNTEARITLPREDSAVPPILTDELRLRKTTAMAAEPRALRLEDLLPESAMKRIAAPQDEQTSGLRSLLAKAA
jgi:hypothetical protein